jgi:hypothetical protein
VSPVWELPLSPALQRTSHVFVMVLAKKMLVSPKTGHGKNAFSSHWAQSDV